MHVKNVFLNYLCNLTTQIINLKCIQIGLNTKIFIILYFINTYIYAGKAELCKMKSDSTLTYLLTIVK